MCVLSARLARADDATYESAEDWFVLAGGVLTGFVLHEAGHLTFDVLTDHGPKLKPVEFGPVPFFSIAPQNLKTRGELYGATMMGFFVEAIYTEMIFANYPDLRHRHHPFFEGLLLLHFALDLGYALTGVAGIGPHESDVNGMARAAGVSPAAISSMLALPLVFDLLRYFKPRFQNRSIGVGANARWLMFGGVFLL